MELLAPAGSLEKLKMAITYGADAVYAGWEAFSLRAAAKNFTSEELKEGIDFAHERGRKVYVAANIIPRNRDLDAFPEFLEEMRKIRPDALIIADLGAFMMAKRLAPELPLHISTQAVNVNYETARTWHELGAKRVVLARELSLAEIREIRDKTPEELELEAFVHGAMCISVSGRCLLSNYMTNRDGNKGECAHPCRWKYTLVEKQRPGEDFPIYESERGTYIFNSKDLNMIEHIPELAAAGLTSLKIEGRIKTEYYVASVVKAYRRALDQFNADPEHYQVDPDCVEELLKVSNRRYTTGFYFGPPGQESQVYTSSTYIREYDIVGLVKGFDEDTGETVIEQRNRFFTGDTLEIVPPDGKFIPFTVCGMRNGDGERIDCAPHAQMTVRMKLPGVYPERTILRKRKEAAEEV